MINALCRPIIHYSIPDIGKQLLTNPRSTLVSKVNSFGVRNFSKSSSQRKYTREKCYAYVNPPQETSIPKMAFGGAIWGFSFASGKFAFDSLVSTIENLRKTD
ncbi:MAG: hypothetical protein ACI8RA_002924 [Chlamydiales bacterium]|jgi:hypothetical protein